MALRRSFVLFATYGCVASLDTLHLTESLHSFRSRSRESCDQFCDWLKTQGANISKIEIRLSQNKTNEYGVFLKDSLGLKSMLPWNKSLAVFPSDLALTPRSALMDGLVGQELQNLFQETEFTLSGILAFYIALQKTLGVGSPYHQWIEMLPGELSTPMFYSDKQLEELKGTPLFRAVQSFKSKLRKEWDLLEANGLRQLCKKLGVTKCPKFDDYIWAHGIVWSRCLELPQSLDQDTNDPHSFAQSLGIVPGIDFLNHSNTPNCTWRMSTNSTTSQIQLERISSGWNLNQELTLSYGDKSNEELLFGSGFVLDHNPHEKLTMVIPFAQTGKSHNRKLQLLNQLSLSPVITLPKSTLEEANKLMEKNKLVPILMLIPEETWSLIALQNLSEEAVKTMDSNQLQATIEDTINTEEWITRCIAFKVFLESILEDLEGRNGTGRLEQDIQLLEKLNDDSFPNWLRNCVIYRSVQKKMLRDWIEVLKFVIERLKMRNN